MSNATKLGTLMIIGGGEDRTDTMNVLQAFIALAGGRDQPLVIITAASKVPDKVWDMYRQAFSELGASRVKHVHLDSRSAADDPQLARQIAEARGIFMTGGDQKRLVAMIGGTRVELAMRQAHAQHGACIAGTSAGASGMCTHMLAAGKAELAPEKGAARLAAGLGFVSRVVIDQHFSQRHRINRLLSVVAQSPFLLGAGIDEDTALIVHGDSFIEVIGEGCVSVVDCRQALSNMVDLAPGAVPEMLDVRLHLLPAGSAFSRTAADVLPERLLNTPKPAPPPLVDFIDYLTDWASES
jgi:cyanophycinase